MGMDIDGLGHNALPRFVMHRTNSFADILRAEPAMSLYKQVGLFLIWMQSKNEWHGFADLAQPTCRKDAAIKTASGSESEKLTAPIENIVIAGAGQAGGRAAEALRARGFRGAITILGEEPHPPYERPQLSKAMLHSADAPVAYIKQARDWSDVLNVRLETGATVIDCDADRRTVSTADGRSFAFDRLLIATGTRPRRLAALENSGIEIQYLRNVEDALRFRKSVQHQSRIVIVGGGVIGLEAACAAATNGCRVTVIESEPRLLARAFPPLVSDLVAAKHRSHGVAFIFGATVTGTTPDGVQLSNGEAIEADLVLVGIGVEPVPTVAERLGLPSQGGIAVDACGRTAASGVFCAGDAALQLSRCHGRAIRVETWANAQNQAISVAGQHDRRDQGV